VDTQGVTAPISFVSLYHHCCSKVKILDSSIIVAFISKRDFIFNNANLLTSDRLAVLVDLMCWVLFICEPGFSLLEAWKF
jgi:hypothetical protein